LKPIDIMHPASFAKGVALGRLDASRR